MNGKLRILPFTAVYLLSLIIDFGIFMAVKSAGDSTAIALTAEILGALVAAAFCFCGFQLLVYRRKFASGLHTLAAVISYATFCVGAFILARFAFTFLQGMGQTPAVLICLIAVAAAEYFYLPRKVFA